MWKPQPEQATFIELVASIEGMPEAEFVEMAVLAVAEYKLRTRIKHLLQLVAKLPKEAKCEVWDEIQTLTLALEIQYYQGIQTLPALDDEA